LNTVDIHFNKPILFAMVAFFLFGMIFTTYVTFSPDIDADFSPYAIVAVDIASIVIIFPFALKAFTNYPAIRLSKNHIGVYHKGKFKEFGWEQVKHIFVEGYSKEENKNGKLVLKTTEGELSISLNLLTKKTPEIKEALAQYQPHSKAP